MHSGATAVCCSLALRCCMTSFCSFPMTGCVQQDSCCCTAMLISWSDAARHTPCYLQCFSKSVFQMLRSGRGIHRIDSLHCCDRLRSPLSTEVARYVDGMAVSQLLIYKFLWMLHTALHSHTDLAVSLRSYTHKPCLDCVKPFMLVSQPRCLQEACEQVRDGLCVNTYIQNGEGQSPAEQKCWRPPGELSECAYCSVETAQVYRQGWLDNSNDLSRHSCASDHRDGP